MTHSKQSLKSETDVWSTSGGIEGDISDLKRQVEALTKVLMDILPCDHTHWSMNTWGGTVVCPYCGAKIKE